MKNIKTIISLIGKTNVGKSTIFNWLAKSNICITGPQPMLTTDSISLFMNFYNLEFELIDTAGFSDFNNYKNISRQEFAYYINKVIEKSNYILFIVDVKLGLNALDFKIATLLKMSKKNIILIVNKCDSIKFFYKLDEFYQLGVGIPFPISAIQGKGFYNLFFKIKKNILEDYEKVSKKLNKDSSHRICSIISIIGKTNVGKSTILNGIVKKKRSVVSNYHGTTVDPVSVYINFNYKKYKFIDTAGVNKKLSKIESKIDKSIFKSTLKSISVSNLSIMVLDYTSKITKQDVRIINLIFKLKKAMLILINKCVKINQFDKKKYIKDLHEKFSKLKTIPSVFIENNNIEMKINRILILIEKLIKRYFHRISTHKLNLWLNEIKRKSQIPFHKIKIYFLIQVMSGPPTFILYCSNPKNIRFHYKRYLLNNLVNNFNLYGIPIILLFQKK